MMGLPSEMSRPGRYFRLRLRESGMSLLPRVWEMFRLRESGMSLLPRVWEMFRLRESLWLQE
jgi:hypothetical protein